MKKYYHFIGIIILIIILTKVDFQKLIISFSKLNLLFFSLSNLMLLPFLLLKSYRWRYLLKLQGIDYPMRESFLSYLGGIYAGIATPLRIGEAIKAVYLKKDKNVPLGLGLASVFVDRFFDLYILVLSAGIGLFYFSQIKDIKYVILVSIIFLFLLITPLLLLNSSFLDRIAKIIYKSMISGLDRDLFAGQFKTFFSGVKKIITQQIFLPFVLTILAYLIFFGQCYLLARIISIDFSYFTVAILVSISNIISMLPITIFGIGVREAGLVYLFSLRGINAETALVYSFLLFLSFYVINGILAFFGWYAKGINKKD